MNKFINLGCVSGFMILSLAILSGCSDSPTADDPGNNEPLPASDLSFSEHILPIFNNRCAPCHINQSQSGVNLASYDNVMGSVGTQYGTEIVKPEEPDESPLVDKIEPDPEIGARMPQGASPLRNDQIQAIRKWIEEGAENN